ncbi:MAG TPA: FCD domain-containing protein [Arachidicoccus soli]|uniref:FadR family transcriptional regulator n=1 Tax=Arachidicoccus soli TaxID=2341117 RepID=A0A386HS91_9BACT|nr:FCD domain-containing protein [Arachidicoccus soli]AYD48797.1 FadR family transcriptional regulator [Arachidicoccus soli]HEU0228774.1 FCD domain-containing protein [Arachidicoccus soli]
MEQNFLVDRTEKSIVELLMSKQYKVGDVIPKELELVTMLGVSRTIVREAFTRLRIKGFIESRKKRGTIIKSPNIVSVLEQSMNPNFLGDATLKDIFEMRLALEVGISDLIFKRATNEDILELRKIVAKEPEEMELDIFEIEQEIAFHGKLYEITGNTTMKDFQKMLLPIFNYVHNSSSFLTPIPKVKRMVSHKDLVDIIEKGTPNKLRKAMRDHLNPHFVRLFR